MIAEPPALAASAALKSVNGTFEDLCTFLCWSERTGRRRLKDRAIAYRRQGRKILVWEDDVIRFAVPQYVADRRLAPGEAQDLVRREWRKHLALRKAAA